MFCHFPCFLCAMGTVIISPVGKDTIVKVEPLPGRSTAQDPILNAPLHAHYQHKKGFQAFLLVS